MKKMILAMGIMAMLYCDNTNTVATCETTPKPDLSSGQELCSVTGGAKHFRIEALLTAAPHTVFILFMGFDDNKNLPTGRGQMLKADQFKAQFYHGGAGNPPAMPSGSTSFYFGTEGFRIEHNKFNTIPVTVCFDVSSENGKPTMMTYWVSGEKGADCKNFSTLNSATAQTTRNWSGGKTAIAKKKNYIYQSAGVSPKKVVVYNETKGK